MTTMSADHRQVRERGGGVGIMLACSGARQGTAVDVEVDHE